MDSVELIRALASLSGVSVSSNDSIDKLKQIIGHHEHYLFILVDGLGTSFLKKTLGSGFFHKHQVLELQSVFPSTTAAALTSIATAEYPCTHGSVGWWTHLEEFQRTSVLLPFLERFSGKNLAEFGINASDVFYFPSYYSKIQRAVCSYHPKAYVHSEFSSYSRGFLQAEGYDKIEEALDYAENFFTRSTLPTFEYLYYPVVDACEHQYGTDSLEAKEAFRNCERAIEEFYLRNKGKVRIIITADHGLIDIPEKNNFFIDEKNEILSLLNCPPSSEARVPMFHVKKACHEQFKKLFKMSFSNEFELLSIDECEKRKLFGKDSFHPIAKNRVGDYIALPKGPYTLQYKSSEYEPTILKAFHGALSAEETQVPLLVM